ncbi:LytR/AlgR family response regulator transcription factor [Roseateles chitosanitabidus]|jgi:two-component system response regulator AlgR|uniref:LytR/AlgR family response regulator transcription factor n=1 Tax=Roseateles chitosanitabidus TaxID=65048 RepID=UPI00082AD8CB|nr:LytTR family DNA-binding domain-containing protein [Roseateles chitosanitabidus]MBO9686446.1 response regulator transcription factor [Roseateles chitosanitabidus]
MLTHPPLRVLIVDDEPLARLRLRGLVEGNEEPRAEVVAEAGSGEQALMWLKDHACDLVLLDVQMPGLDGLGLAQALRGRPFAPAVVFVTAHPQHALQAFELEALDYLTKPVRRERLQASLARAAQRVGERAAIKARDGQEPAAADGTAQVINITERGRLLRVPLGEVLYFKAELKYLTLRTATQSHVMDGSLSDLEQRLGERFLRVHRNALVAKAAVRELERHVPTEGVAEPDGDGSGELGWAVRIAHVNEWLAVSRRQVAAVREALAGQR